MEHEQPDLISARVAAIIASAEQAAAGVREHAEARARERIAEGDRAAENRVGAAEAEAEEILRSARAHAEAARNRAVSAVAGIHPEAERVRADARPQPEPALAAAQEEAAQPRAARPSGAPRGRRAARLAHGGMTARLDQAVPGEGTLKGTGERPRTEPDDDFDVPEFIPRG